jgi:hypothetical protein
MKRKTIVEILASLLILLFVYAALSKLFDFENFRVQLGKSPFITGFSGVVSWALPIVELAIALLLTFSRSRLLGMFAALFLMTLFSAYIFTMLHYSYYIPCSCGGVLSKLTWGQHLVFNIFFVAVSIAGIFIIGLSKKEPIHTKNEPAVIFT